tara:strand:+ start:103 stop:249 length:147 start_codon:yes stop_codon:yes gene_type:complete
MANYTPLEINEQEEGMLQLLNQLAPHKKALAFVANQFFTFPLPLYHIL